MRQNRTIKINGVYHITAQTNRGEPHFNAADARLLYQQVLRNARKKYKFRQISLAFCGNWVDLYLRPGKKYTISHIMQWVQARFAERWNKAHKEFGSVWRDRFYSEVVEQVKKAVMWMKTTFEKVKEGLFKNRVKIWSINEQFQGQSPPA